MCLEISDFSKILSSVTLPSPLWGIHVDPVFQFIAITHVSLNLDKICLDKGVLLTGENGSIKVSVTLNNEIVQFPNVSTIINSVYDLLELLAFLHNIKFCLNEDQGLPKCLKYIPKDDPSNLCDFCSFGEICNDKNKNEIVETLANSSLENLTFNDSTLHEIGESSPKINFICDICNKNFTSLEVLTKHTLTHKKKIKNTTTLCTVCGYTFTSQSSLRTHMLIHSNDKPHQCKFCNKSFSKKYNLNVHLHIHSGEKMYICSICGKTYRSRSNLSTHVNSAHCDKKRHPCELCQMSFAHPRILRVHMRKHTGEKPFMCQVCSKVFAKKIHLTVHMRTHTGEKPYSCIYCGKGFTTSGNLSSHKKSNHANR